MTNPSNPCGSAFSVQHQLDILAGNCNIFYVNLMLLVTISLVTLIRFILTKNLRNLVENLNIAVAERHGLPLIADEIYQNMVFEGESKSFGELSENVPVLSCGGLAKRFYLKTSSSTISCWQ